ncbi:MAG: hypothetical protein PHV06_12125, partial [bacterium]|nr:hypothetical protein [bacterium]
MSGDERYFRKNHGDVSKDFKRMLISKEVVFSENVFNKCVGGNVIESWKIPKSENLKKRNPNLNLRLKQIIRMIYFYVKDDYKKTREIKTLSRKKLIDFRNGVSVCLFDFFYWY